MSRSRQAPPVVDLGRLAVERSDVLADARGAAREDGFFYLVGHGISELTSDMLSVARRFFSLPVRDTLAIEMVNSPHFLSYSRAGYEHTRGRPDWCDQIDVGAEREPLPFDPSAPAWARPCGPNQWPKALAELRLVLRKYQSAVTALAASVQRVLAAALEQPESIFEPIDAPEPNQSLRIIRCPGRAKQEEDQGVGAHRHSRLVTIPLQDETADLQVERADGWIDAPPSPASLVVDIGEILELASNGYLRADIHRVVSAPAAADRLSVAFILGTRLDATVSSLDPARQLAAQAQGAIRDPLFGEVGKNNLKSRLRAHHDVARHYHADLLAPSAVQSEPASSY